MLKPCAFTGMVMFLCLFIISMGCSSHTDPSLPAVIDETSQAAESSHITWGMWQFIADPAAQTLDVVQLRGVDMHLNALPFLEPPPLVNLTLESLKFNGNIIEADIGLRHPFLGLNEFTGFDVCGTLITNGNVTGFDNSDIVMAGDGDTRLLNPTGSADGGTRRSFRILQPCSAIKMAYSVHPTPSATTIQRSMHINSSATTWTLPTPL